MMSEERINEEIKRLEQLKLQLLAQFNQVEGALCTFRVVLDPEPEPTAEVMPVE